MLCQNLKQCIVYSTRDGMYRVPQKISPLLGFHIVVSTIFRLTVNMISRYMNSLSCFWLRWFLWSFCNRLCWQWLEVFSIVCFPHHTTQLGSKRRLDFYLAYILNSTHLMSLVYWVILPCDSQDRAFEEKRRYNFELDINRWLWLGLISWGWISIGDQIPRLYILLIHWCNESFILIGTHSLVSRNDN